MFSERLKQARKRRKMSQLMLSEKLGTKQTTVSGWENDGNEPAYEMLVCISKALGVTTDYLLGITDNPLSLVRNDTPYAQVTPFEKEILAAFRDLPLEAKKVVCQSLGLQHPASERAKAKS